MRLASAIARALLPRRARSYVRAKERRAAVTRVLRSATKPFAELALPAHARRVLHAAGTRTRTMAG